MTSISIRRAVRPGIAGAAALALAGLWGACSMALDWRTMRPDGWSLQVAMPCRPANQSRVLNLAGAQVELRMLICTEADHTFAVASAQLADPASVLRTLQAMGQAARGNINGRVVAERAVHAKGMTPSPEAHHWRLEGRLPDGRSVIEEVMVFSHGLRVFQATVMGPVTDARLTSPFFDALQVQN